MSIRCEPDSLHNVSSNSDLTVRWALRRHLASEDIAFGTGAGNANQQVAHAVSFELAAQFVVEDRLTSRVPRIMGFEWSARKDAAFRVWGVESEMSQLRALRPVSPATGTAASVLSIVVCAVVMHGCSSSEPTTVGPTPSPSQNYRGTLTAGNYAQSTIDVTLTAG